LNLGPPPPPPPAPLSHTHAHAPRPPAVSSDAVLPDKFPQKWDLQEVTLVALALGLVACLSSLLLVAFLMHASSRNPGDFLGNVFGSSGRNWVTWYEVRCIIYLKVSVSDFLTLFSARTRGFFWERHMSRALSIAAAFALTTSTLLALFWGDIFAGLDGAFMAGLRYSKGAVLATWLYCVLWWFVQDAAKVATYHLVDLLTPTGLWKAKQAAFVRRFHAPSPDSSPVGSNEAPKGAAAHH
jgi:H+-transporting ATPase